MKTAEEKAKEYAEEAILELNSDAESMQDFVQKLKKYAKVDFLAGYNEAMKEVKEMKANAQLIAAAPELLDALIETDKDLCVLEGNMAQIEKSDPRADGMTTLVSEWRERNKKAINKALGL